MGVVAGMDGTVVSEIIAYWEADILPSTQLNTNLTWLIIKIPRWLTLNIQIRVFFFFSFELQVYQISSGFDLATTYLDTGSGHDCLYFIMMENGSPQVIHCMTLIGSSDIHEPQFLLTGKTILGVGTSKSSSSGASWESAEVHKAKVILQSGKHYANVSW